MSLEQYAYLGQLCKWNGPSGQTAEAPQRVNPRTSI
jgi:hypothetical protein